MTEKLASLIALMGIFALMGNANAEMVLGVFMAINVSTELANVEIMKNVELTNHTAMLLQENVVCTWFQSISLNIINDEL